MTITRGVPVFGKKKNATDDRTPKSVRELGNAPPTAYDEAKREWALRNGDEVVAASRWFVFAMALLPVVGILGLAIKGLTPLKQTVPYMVNVNSENHLATASRVEASRFAPSDLTIKATLAQWVQLTLALDARRTDGNIRIAYDFLRGNAIQEYADFMRDTKPLVRLREDPSLSRVIEIKTVQFIAKGVCQVRVSSVERNQMGDTKASRYAVTMHYDIVPPTTDQEMLKNAAGVYISHFEVSEENK